MKIAQLLITTTLLITTSSSAEIYKWVDKDGSLHFSDQAPTGQNVEKLDIKPSDVTVMKSPRATTAQKKLLPASNNSSKTQKYTSIKITQPTNDIAVRANDGAIKILCNIKPALNTKKQHRIRFHIDGKPLGSIGTTCSISLTALNRGTHSVAAEVIDKNGKSLIKSPTNHFHLKSVSAL